MQSFDNALLEWVHGFSSLALDGFFKFATDFGGVTVVTLVTIFLAIFFVSRKRYELSARLLVGVGGAVAVSTLLKMLIGRARPDLWPQLVSETSHSFPSNHATASLALVLCFGFILWRTKYRWWVVGLGTLYVMTIALSRLYLGVHFPTDILGGWFVAVVWVSLVWRLSERFQFQKA